MSHQMTSRTIPDEHKAREIIVQMERIADQILMHKQELVVLDKRRQETREAIRLIEERFAKPAAAGEQQQPQPERSPRSKRIWITIGSVLMKVDKVQALELLREDHGQLEAEITRIRQMQKVLVGQQRDLEHEQPLRGFDLKPLSDAEISGLRSNLPGF